MNMGDYYQHASFILGLGRQDVTISVKTFLRPAGNSPTKKMDVTPYQQTDNLQQQPFKGTFGQ